LLDLADSFAKQTWRTSIATMGSAASSKNVETAVSEASQEQLNAAVGTLSAEDRGRMKEALEKAMKSEVPAIKVGSAPAIEVTPAIKIEVPAIQVAEAPAIKVAAAEEVPAIKVAVAEAPAIKVSAAEAPAITVAVAEAPAIKVAEAEAPAVKVAEAPAITVAAAEAPAIKLAVAAPKEETSLVKVESIGSAKTDASTEARKPVEMPADMSPEKVTEACAKIHSAIRWGKTEEEVKAVVTSCGFSTLQAVDCVDAKNGNRTLHIAAQNGHLDLTKMLVNCKADMNAQNFKGQSALHMSVEFDMYFQSKFLIDSGASKTLKNESGCEAIYGIEGEKKGADAWDSPLTILKSATNKEEFKAAFDALESCDTSLFDKASLAMTGMRKKKLHKDEWDPARFTEIMKRF